MVPLNISLIDTKFSSVFFSSLFSELLFDHSFSMSVCQMGLLPSVLCLFVFGTPEMCVTVASADGDVPASFERDQY